MKRNLQSLVLSGAVLAAALSSLSACAPLIVGGAVVGALLGPLAVLMFFASGPKMKVCPYCAEKVQPEARVCKHCHKDLPVSAGRAASVS